MEHSPKQHATRHRRITSRKIMQSVSIVTLALILNACSGGSSTKTTPSALSTTVGDVCLTGLTSYSIKIDEQEEQQYAFDPDPMGSVYLGNIGGQIRGLAELNIAVGTGQPVRTLFWGKGASIKYGAPGSVSGTILLEQPGAVIDLAPLYHEGLPLLIYGTERGIGAIRMDASGEFSDLAREGVWRPVPAGVLSVSLSEDQSQILFSTRDGLLQMLAVNDFLQGEPCARIVAGAVTATENEDAFLPVKVLEKNAKRFLLLRAASSIPSTAPTFGQAYDPVLKAMLSSKQFGRVQMLTAEGQGVTELSLTAEDESFRRFDRFLPMDIAIDDQYLYVIGLAFAEASVTAFLADACAGEDDLTCLREAAQDGTLTKYAGDDGLYKFIAGFFAYRIDGDATQAESFAPIQLTTFTPVEDAAPFLYAIAAKGGSVFVRGPTFLAEMSQKDSAVIGSRWRFDRVAEVDRANLMPGLPNRIIPITGGVVSSMTAVRRSDGSGASALEMMTSDGIFANIDTGALLVQIEGAGPGKNLLATVEMFSEAGGNLFLESTEMRIPIDLPEEEGFVSNAAFDGTRLAFAWTEDTSHSWYVALQEGYDSTSRGQISISRAGGADGEFQGFPSTTTQDELYWKKRGVGDIILGDDVVAVLLIGEDGTKRYAQIALYSIVEQSASYMLKLAGLSSTIVSQASESTHAGALHRIQKAQNVIEIVFSAADGVRLWKVTADTSNPSAGTMEMLFGISQLIDVAVDAMGGDGLAWIAGDKIYIKNLANTSAPGVAVQVPRLEGSSLTKLLQAHLAMSGSILALASPYGAAASFSIYNVESGTPKLSLTSNFAHFRNVRIFSSYPNFLLASSPSSGVEIYAIQ